MPHDPPSATNTGEPAVDNKKKREVASATTWWVAIIIAVITVIGSLGSSYLLSKKAAGEKIDEVLGASLVPVGSVIASLLPPQEFYRQAKIANAVYDPETYTWVLADGRDVTRSAYERLLPGHPTMVPDLRGRFLRGINESRQDFLSKGDPAGARAPGTEQPDALATHTHTAVSVTNVAEALALGFGSMAEHSAKWSPGAVGGISVNANPGGEVETRPRNSAVFWYIRIN